MIRIITASVRSPSPIDKRAAALNNNVMGLLKCERNNTTPDECEDPFNVLGPKVFNLSSAAETDRPVSEQDRICIAVLLSRLQKLSKGEEIEGGIPKCTHSPPQKSNLAQRSA